jgi:hypothetical protein
LCPFDYFFLLAGVLCQYGHKIFGNWSGQFEILREFHQLIELHSTIMRDLVSPTLLHFHLLVIGKLTELIENLSFHIRRGIFSGGSAFCAGG